MSYLYRTLAVAAFAAAAAGCVSHGPGGIAYSTDDASKSVSASTTGAPENVGATGGSAGGSISGSAPEKEKRGNTPVGMDRDGHGPAAGAIIDPTGAATRGTPY